MDDIPIIDLADLGLDNQCDEEIQRSTFERVANELDEAFANIGFAYLRNHGIVKSDIQNVTNETQHFFHMDLNTKMKYKNTEEFMWKHGYNRPGIEFLQQNTNIHEFREAYNFGDPEGPFPEELPKLRTAVINLSSDALKLLSRLYKTLAIALNLKDENFFINHHKRKLVSDSGSMMRVLYYPPMDKEVDPGTMRLGEHSDYGTITLLMQCDQGGLEVKNVSGEWIPAPPIPDTVILNVGELLTVWSNGRYTATPHRVRVPDDKAHREKTRRSIAMFGYPNLDSIVSPLFGNNEDFTPINAGEYMMKRFRETYL